MKRKIFSLLLFNAIFLIYSLHYFLPVSPYILTLAVNLVLFILQGLAWAGIFKQKRFQGDLTAHLVVIFSLSIAICAIGLSGHLMLKIKPTSLSQFIYIIIVTNIGLLFNPLSLRRIKNYRAAIAFFFILYTFSYLFSAYVVNRPFEDSDLDLQGTSYSLIYHLTPRMLTDRKTIYNFSHPLLPALCAANTMLFFDNLEKVKYYYDASVEAESIKQENPSVGQKIMLVSSDNREKEYRIIEVDKNMVTLDSAIIENVKYDYGRVLPEEAAGIDYNLIAEMRTWRIIEDCYKQFFQTPFLISTRASGFFFTALTGLILFLFLFKITGSHFLSSFGTILYLGNPEIFISLSSIAYMGITSFILITTAYLYYVYGYDDQKREKVKVPLFLSGFLCAVVNHKALILILAILIMGIIIRFRSRKKGMLQGIYKNYILLGFGAGLLAYWFYGLAIDANTFFLDHFQYHFLNRILHKNVLGYGGYFSIREFWSAYSANTGKPFFWISLLAAIYYLKGVFKKNENMVIFSLWFIIGAVAFTLVDQRETYHLVYITPALILLTMKWLSERRAIVKNLLLFVLAYVVFSNFYIISSLIRKSIDILSIIPWI